MSVRTSFRLVLAAAATALLGACATAPQPLQGSFLPVTPEQAVIGQQVGASVRWGGRIVQTTPGADSTCFQVVATPLNASGRPDSNAADNAQGRFVACRAGFYDPAVFTPGREVTFVGRVQDTESVRIGEYDYRLPRMAADVVYLWPIIREVRVVHDPWGPWGPWGPGPWGRWGWWGW
ncbi:Slp family lipoprotein [Pseudoxanthomonas suwonensis]|uniref:Membrane protein n=1 Tax=Pseudoxanthomonas suwonensis TaxID=314722 RepID=A0A0E3YZX5_9GAMM|nr:Slp family lipoprotein [Pseudoxanthomonas suwonensis]AKC85729.1 membrane protein [Pseudoxanthomonas suwonensis]